MMFTRIRYRRTCVAKKSTSSTDGRCADEFMKPAQKRGGHSIPRCSMGFASTKYFGFANASRASVAPMACQQDVR